MKTAACQVADRNTWAMSSDARKRVVWFQAECSFGLSSCRLTEYNNNNNNNNNNNSNNKNKNQKATTWQADGDTQPT